MNSHVMHGRHGSLAGRAGRFRIAWTAMALPWRVSSRSSTPSGAVATGPRGPAIQQRALRHRF